MQFIATYLASLKIHYWLYNYLNNIILYIPLKYFVLSIRSLIFYNTVVIKVALGVEINYKEKIDYILEILILKSLSCTSAVKVQCVL